MVKWQVLIGKAIVCLATEILLDAAGLSQIANYGEFLEHQFDATTQGVVMIDLVGGGRSA